MGLIVVGIADAQISSNPEDTLVTYSLGSCLGITFYEPYRQIGAMIHIMLPDCSLENNAPINPYKYVSSGVPLLLKKLNQKGIHKNRLIIKVAGGGQILQDNRLFNIGERNFRAFRDYLYKESLKIHRQDVGGTVNRTIRLSLQTGVLSIKRSSKEILEI